MELVSIYIKASERYRIDLYHCQSPVGEVKFEGYSFLEYRLEILKPRVFNSYFSCYDTDTQIMKSWNVKCSLNKETIVHNAIINCLWRIGLQARSTFR